MTGRKVAISLITIGDKVLFAKYGLVTEGGEEVPIGAVLRFHDGFKVRQYDERGAGLYGSPPEEVWTAVSYAMLNGELGLFAPAYTEKIPTGRRFLWWRMSAKVRHQPVFIPLMQIRQPSIAVVVALPAG